MSAAPQQEQSLLVKTQPGRPAPFALEDLRTGRRRQFGAVAELLVALGEALQPDPPASKE